MKSSTRRRNCLGMLTVGVLLIANEAFDQTLPFREAFAFTTIPVRISPQPPPQRKGAPRSLLVCFSDGGYDEVDDMRHEIEEMRLEALRRIDALSQKMSSSSRRSSGEVNTVTQSAPQTTSAKTYPPSQKQSLQEEVVSQATAVMEPPLVEKTEELGFESLTATDSKETQRPFLEKTAAANEVTVSAAGNEVTVLDPASKSNTTVSFRKTAVQTERDELSLLDGTHWKAMLNIGRETGTWMPKTWGVSGERVLLNLELEFTPDQLFEREEFLNGIGDAKVLHVVKNTLTLSPSMTEGSRVIPVRDGGWRIGRGEGPLGTDILRFYVEVEEEVRHRGGDVYCPKGRVYCTCGYFPMNRPKRNIKEDLKKQQESLGRRYEEITRELEDDTSLISFNKMKLTKDLLQTRFDAGKVTQHLREARIREPDKNLLRLSRQLDVGLTVEGGVCCKVVKGMTTQYPILGRFGVASKDPSCEEKSPSP